MDLSREEAFLMVVNELRENDAEQTTVVDLVSKMSEIIMSRSILRQIYARKTY